jgi:large subunit ribosomal protein L17
MRHRKRTVKLGRTTAHREALLAGLVCNLIKYKRITTTVAKAKAARVLAEKMVTQAKRGTLAARRLIISRLRQAAAAADLIATIAPAFKDRNGGYTRILRIGRRSDSAEMAMLEWVNYVPPAPRKKKTDKGKEKAKGDQSAGAAPAKEREKKAKEEKAADKA